MVDLEDFTYPRDCQRIGAGTEDQRARKVRSKIPCRLGYKFMVLHSGVASHRTENHGKSVQSS